MKRLLPMLSMSAAVVLAGCSLISPSTPPPTYTPLPTYTPFPSNTPEPTATATFLPSPTPLPSATPTETPSGDVTPTATSQPTSSSAQLQGTLAFGANLREGPATTYDAVDSLDAGQTVDILGRDLDGLWLLVRTASGLEGWVAVRQFQGPIDIPRIPLAQSIPTPDATQIARITTTPASTTGTPAPTTAAAGPLLFELEPGGGRECETVTITMNGLFHVDALNQDIMPFDRATPEDVVGVRAYQYERSTTPAFINIHMEKPAKGAQCSATDKTCRALTFEVCAEAGADAPTGGSEYRPVLPIFVGTQSYNVFYEETRGTLPVTFTVVEP